ncbi:MAG TPA: TssQ family T6SS-associated lipoprotein [Burkholderiaceae bacterium]|nr:TssQ family T6SS-associated lipoprotein [Burkholderiaceae bacterium]
MRPLLVAAAVCLAACATTPPAPPVPATQSIAALYQRPAERALINGIRFYEEGSFDRAETALRSALEQGLADARDTATAHKYLAFLACAFSRLDECEQHFRDAFAADAKFSLTETEVGHPIWGPIYRKVAAAQQPQAATPARK